VKKKIHKLVSESNEPLSLIGIVSHENDYRLSWAFNQYLNLKFIKTSSLTLEHPKREENPVFSVFKFDDEECFVQYFLIANKSENGFLVPELKNVDYILKITGDIKELSIKELVVKIKKMEFVNTAFIIEDLSAKGFKNIIF
jgi:hypothetical protein